MYGATEIKRDGIEATCLLPVFMLQCVSWEVFEESHLDCEGDVSHYG